MPNEAEFVAAVLSEAVETWNVTVTAGASDWQRMVAAQMGYAGPTDELVTFFHSDLFANLCEWLGIDTDMALARIGLAKRDGCLCASCTNTDDLTISIGENETVHDAIRRLAWHESP